MFDYDAVDIVCTLDALPFRDGEVDALVSRSVLEHVAAPSAVLAEFARCTRPGGIGIHMIPFLFPYPCVAGGLSSFTS
jgi:ubiquinone/menaquinone biosynthesis C-methylase UbiE